jgi:hypothetical protein
MDLRAMALAVKPSQIGLSPASYSEKPWGVLMETAFEGRGSFTLLVLADGTTSLYFSKGGGMLGEGRGAEVRAASAAMLETAARLQGNARPTTATPLPSTGTVNFYFLTAKGTLRYLAAERLLGTGEDPMSELFYAGQAVLAEFEKIAEKRRAKAVPK